MTAALMTGTTGSTSDNLPIDLKGRGGSFQIAVSSTSIPATSEIQASPDGGTTWFGIPSTKSFIVAGQVFMLEAVVGFTYRLWLPASGATYSLWAAAA